MLRELAESAADDFGWGYNGGGTSAAAAAILADALHLGDPGKCGIGYATYPENEVLLQLREDFCDDLLSHALRPVAPAPRRRPALVARLVPAARHQRAARRPARGRLDPQTGLARH
ncbi:hypothetical protein R2F25_00425 [Streptomyces sp. UP1A-1]|nr:hypothetical protein [Streptomyces sp. UP1A-1]